MMQALVTLVITFILDFGHAKTYTCAAHPEASYIYSVPIHANSQLFLLNPKILRKVVIPKSQQCFIPLKMSMLKWHHFLLLFFFAFMEQVS